MGGIHRPKNANHWYRHIIEVYLADPPQLCRLISLTSYLGRMLSSHVQNLDSDLSMDG